MTITMAMAIEVLGYLAATVNFAAYSMKTMIPLRIVAITSNVLFIAYAASSGIVPVLILHSILLPLNGLRLYEMLKLVRDITVASTGDLNMNWLKPFMRKREIAKGMILFTKGDQAEEMFIVLNGRFQLRELGIQIPHGSVVGELGFLAPEQRRGQTLECIEGGEVLAITYADVRQLYFQNPEFGFFFLRLTSERLFQNVARLEAEVARLHDVAAKAPA